VGVWLTFAKRHLHPGGVTRVKVRFVATAALLVLATLVLVILVPPTRATTTPRRVTVTVYEKGQPTAIADLAMAAKLRLLVEDVTADARDGTIMEIVNDYAIEQSKKVDAVEVVYSPPHVVKYALWPAGESARAVSAILVSLPTENGAVVYVRGPTESHYVSGPHGADPSSSALNELRTLITRNSAR